MITPDLISVLGGFVLNWVATRYLGVTNPLGVDKPYSDCRDLLLKVKSGDAKLDDMDREALKSIKALIEELVK